MAQAPQIREASWDVIDPHDPRYVWTLNRTASTQANVTSMCGSLKVWVNVQKGGHVFCTWVYYDKLDRTTGNKIETLKFPYEAHFLDFAPAHTAREVFSSVLNALADAHPWLKWFILIFSVFETGTGIRGRSRRAVNNRTSQQIMPMLMRGLFPPIVAFVSTAFAEASVLFVVSSLPFFRGNVKAVWWMKRDQATAEIWTQFLMSLLIVYCVVQVCCSLLPKYQAQVNQGGNDTIAYPFNPFEILLTSSWEEDQMTFKFSVGFGAAIFLASIAVYAAFLVVLQASGGTLAMHRGFFSSDHSRSFISWRFAKKLRMARALAEPALGKVEFALEILTYLVTFILLFFVELDIPTFFLTIMAYEMDLGYAMGNDVAIMTMFNVAQSNFQSSLNASTITEDMLAPELTWELEEIEGTYVFLMDLKSCGLFGIGRGYKAEVDAYVNGR